jgi:DNA-binding LytR/AlgR family response regulator
MDIEMRHVNGIVATEQIRSLDHTTLFIYITSHEKYTRELINFEPFRFIQKPINTSFLQSSFETAVYRVSQRSEMFTFTYDKRIIQIPSKYIRYFSSDKRLIYLNISEPHRDIYTNPDELNDRFYGKLNQIEKELAVRDTRFIRIHQSFLVNFDYVVNIKHDRITLSDEEILVISSDRIKKVRSLLCTKVIPND